MQRFVPAVSRNFNRRSRVRRKLSFLAAFGAGFLIVAIPGTAVAASGVVSYFGPINGINYKDCNKIDISSYASAGTFIAKNGTGNLPANSMAVRARLFKGTSSASRPE